MDILHEQHPDTFADRWNDFEKQDGSDWLISDLYKMAALLSEFLQEAMIREACITEQSHLPALKKLLQKTLHIQQELLQNCLYS